MQKSKNTGRDYSRPALFLSIGYTFSERYKFYRKRNKPK